MKAHGGVDVQLQHSRLRHWMEMNGQLHDPAARLPIKYSQVPSCVGGLVGLRASMEGVEKNEISFSCRESDPKSSVVQNIA
jgi:hypothetical protein